MGKVFKGIFGGKDTSQQNLTLEDNRRRQDFIEEATRQARSDVLRVAPGAEQARNAGFQSAIDALTGVSSARIDALQNAGMLGQSALVGGLNLTKDALLGNPTDFSGFQPRQVRVDSSVLNRQLPQSPGIAQSLSTPNFEERELAQGIQTDADLFNAASRGRIPGLTSDEQQFFAQLLTGSPEFNMSNRFVGDPRGQIPGVIGAPEAELTAQNRNRVSNLLTQFDKFRRP